MEEPVSRSGDPTLRSIFSSPQIQDRIQALADDLHRVYQSRDLLIVVIADGARRFAETLVDRLEEHWMLPQVLYVRATRSRGMELGEVQVEHVDPSEFEGRDVLIVDDIADEGRTLDAVMQLVQEGEPRSVEAAVLISKKQRRRVDLPIRFVGFELERGWVVGFGMDLDGRYRELDYIAVIEGSETHV